ncbi:LacI family DNA-binding transcriptional regulator [Ruegeria sp. R13_0]|uniref:LacI family DNA-binding transcriptional regulator n=1 Tax=Ruegeria sp. R13_0 TaxID=2821099 RepID=UPI001ADC773B|nr:LacI family DNA-binding transcriptional regulator [Ruegeria sp. R13_0]MBO9432751.1 LacI family DNA-binding transcriptional regulator [Ruegeria sp. R13_0]
MRRPTIIDVANSAGVSKSTVSLVLQGSTQVRPETRKLVHTAMKEIGYVYNRSAANLRSTGTALIGLVINDLTNPFFTEFATSLQMALGSRGYAVVLANTNEDPELQDQVVGAMLEHGVSALILSPAYGDVTNTLSAVKRAGIPLMQVLRQVESETGRFPFIAPDYAEGGRAATQYLIETGARNIAFVGGLDGAEVTQERLSGYISAMKDNHLQPIVKTGESSRSFGHEATVRLFKEHPACDAAVCFNDLVAFGMINACHETQAKIGTEFQIVGFDDIKEASECWPALSTVHCGVSEFGEQVADTVLLWLQDGVAPAQHARTTTRLVLRQTTKDMV